MAAVDGKPNPVRKSHRVNSNMVGKSIYNINFNNLQ